MSDEVYLRGLIWMGMGYPGDMGLLNAELFMTAQ